MIKPAGEIAQQPLGFIGIVELPSLPQRPAYRRMQRLGQPRDHVAGFMNLAALERRVGAEGATDDFAQRLGAIDDEQPADLGIKPPLDQVVDERLDDGGVLGCSFDQGERMFVAVSINAEGSDQHQIVADVQPVDLDDQEVQLGQVRRHPRGQPFCHRATNRREAADFEVPSPAVTGRSPSGSRTARLSLRVDTLISIRFMAQRPSQSSACAAVQVGSATSWPS